MGVFDGCHRLLQVDEVLFGVVKGAVHNHGEVLAHNGLRNVKHIHMAFRELGGDGGDNAFVIDSGDGQNNFHGDSFTRVSPVFARLLARMLV